MTLNKLVGKGLLIWLLVNNSQLTENENLIIYKDIARLTWIKFILEEFH